MKRAHVCILGAGISGLSAAYSFVEKGCNVTILEKSANIGGLCASYFSYSGITFDYGPHGIVETTFPDIGKFCADILNNNINRFFNRNIKINFDHITYNYPPNFVEILKKEKLISNISYFLSFLNARLFSTSEFNSFKDVTIARFGKKLSRRFFEEFTEKTWGHPTTELDARFALERIPSFDVVQMFKNLIVTKETNNYSFSYPKKGIFQLPEALKDTFCSDDSKVITNAEIKKIIVDNKSINKVYYNDTYLKCDHVVSTIPLDSLINVMDTEKKVSDAANKLCYRSVLFAFVEINKKNILKDHWVYFQSKKIIFNRIYEPKYFSLETSPEEITGLCLEITISDETKDLNVLKKRIIFELCQWFDISEKDIISVHFETKDHCYPLYLIGYDHNLNIIYDHLNKIENLISIGRQGLFRYLDIDYSIQSGIMSTEIINKKITNKEFSELVQKNGK